MTLKYWETMAVRENENNSREPVNLQKSDAVTAQNKDNALNTSTDAVSTKDDNISVNANSDVVSTQNADNAENENSEQKTKVRKTNLPRPIAIICEIFLTLLSTVGLSLLMALLILITVACAVSALAMIASGGFTIFEAISNMPSAVLVSLQSMGIGFAMLAAGLLIMLASLKCIRYALPATAGLFPKAISTCTSL
ncbi:MAG: hypothetical protein K6E85_13245 [Lachnospiraceae bacterium]|nr:hypothetical protein [Lachnospiraceae bacterium]